MHIILNHSSMVPIYEQLMEQIKSEIINTALKEGEGTYVTASDKQLALEARQREAEADFEKAIDRALAMGMSREDILETVTLLLEEK